MLKFVHRALKNGWMTVTNVTECASAPGTFARSVMRGQRDPGYLITSRTSCSPSQRLAALQLNFARLDMITECALALLLDDASLPAARRAGGVLTPSIAFGSVLVSRLEATGLIQFESEIVRGAEESRKDR